MTVPRELTVSAKVEKIKGMGWGHATNIDSVFDKSLETAVGNGWSNERLEKTMVIIFSDMEFDIAKVGNTPWDTQYDSIVMRFRDAGYTCVPVIVYWNLNAKTTHVPAEPNQVGVVLLSGFSAGLLECFMSGRLEEYTPVNQMMDVLGKDCYQRLRLAA